MDYFKEFELKTPQQKRSIKAVNDIIESLKQLAENEDIAEISTRKLSKHSGYAIGTIFHHFKKFDDLFVYIFLIKRKELYSNLEEIINKHPANQPLSELINNMINSCVHDVTKIQRKTFLFLFNQFLKRTDKAGLVNLEVDRLIEPWKMASQRDNTGTFYNYSENELSLRFRAIQSIIRSPFLEENPIAGTAEHKDITIDIFMRLLTAPQQNE